LLVEEGRHLNRLHQLSDHSVNITTIKEAAKFFVEKMLCIPKSSKKYRDIPYLLKQSYSFDFFTDEQSNPINDCFNHIRNKIPSNQQDELEQKVKNAIQYAVISTTAHSMAPSQSTSQLVNTNTLLTRTKDSNNDDLESRIRNNINCHRNCPDLDAILTQTSDLLLSFKSSNGTDSNINEDNFHDIHLSNNNQNNNMESNSNAIAHQNNFNNVSLMNDNDNTSNHNDGKNKEIILMDDNDNISNHNNRENKEIILTDDNEITTVANPNNNKTNVVIESNAYYNNSIDKSILSSIPYICNPLNWETTIIKYACIEKIKSDQVNTYRAPNITLSDQHYRVITSISRLINRMIKINDYYSAVKTIFCVIIEICNIIPNKFSTTNPTERYLYGKKRCTKSRHLTNLLYDPFMACLTNCHSNNIDNMIKLLNNIQFKKIRTGYKYIGCIKCKKYIIVYLIF